MVDGVSRRWDLKVKKNDANPIIVSVVMPIYNEEKYIKKCIDSLFKQSFPRKKMEWIFVDGMSKDKTKPIIKQYIEEYPHLIKVFDNPDKTVPYAMNIGIKNSIGKYIVRLDAHAEYPEDYIDKCVYYLDVTDADNVGGIAETHSRTPIGDIIAKMLSSRFGVGNSSFRTNGSSGYVDTVPFGAFRREVFEKYGYYDERLTRNQDNEMNYRIRKNGGKIYLARDIHFIYYCRDTISGIIDMALKNGAWNIVTMKLCPGSMGIRHFIPLLFVLSLVGLPILGFFNNVFFYLLILELFLYGSLDCLFSVKASNSLNDFFWLMLLYPVFHISYGLGSIKGIVLCMTKKYGGVF